MSHDIADDFRSADADSPGLIVAIGIEGELTERCAHKHEPITLLIANKDIRILAEDGSGYQQS